MESISEAIIERLLRTHAKPGTSLVDVGSYDVNGTVRPIAKRCGITDYTGVDLREGPNVDHVVPERGAWDLGRKWPVVVTANTLEHTRRPWEFFAQCVSLLEPGGLLIVVAPWNWKIHPHPIDCWRVLPDGLRTLFEDHGFDVLACGTEERLCFGAGRLKVVDPLRAITDATIQRMAEDTDDLMRKPPELVQRAVRGLKHIGDFRTSAFSDPHPLDCSLAGRVAHVFGTGMTRAIQLCRDCGEDPEYCGEQQEDEDE